MCGPIQAEQKKQEEILTQEAIHQELTQLQRWDPAEGQTVEEQRTAHRAMLIQDRRQQNAVMQAAAQLQLHPAQAQQAAPGAPEPMAPPLTYKERRERKRRERVAKRHYDQATAVTYDCVEATSTVVKGRLNALRNGPPANGVDTRVLGSFCQGYRCKKNGRPAGPEDQARANADNAFLAAYTSRDLEQRRPYLERFRRELMDFPLSGDSVSDAYLLRHTGEVKTICDRACYFENIMRDEINRPYFDGLTPTEQALLSRKLDILVQLGSYFTNYLGGIGVNINSGEFYSGEGTRSIATFQGLAEFQKEEVRNLTAGWANDQQSILLRHSNQDLEDTRAAMLADIEENKRQQTDRLPEDMNFSGPAAGYATDELKRYRDLIEARPQRYAQHRQVIQQLYQALYKGMDILNDLALEGMVIQSVIDDKNLSQNPTEHAKTPLVVRRLDQNQAEMTPTQLHLSGITQALDFYLKGRPYTAGARDILERMGYGPQAEAIAQERERQAQEAKAQAEKAVGPEQPE